MLLELADHDGDVDRAVELLASGKYPEYGAVIDRLRAAGRPDEAIGWMDRAVAEGRVSGRMGGTESWLDSSHRCGHLSFAGPRCRRLGGSSVGVRAAT